MKIVAITPDRKMDAVCSVIIEGMNDSGVNVIASDPGNSVINHYTEAEVIDHGRDADYIFAFFGKVRGNRPPKYHLLNEINRPEVTAYIDGSEWTATGYPDGDKVIASPWGNANSQVYEAKFNPRRCKGSPWINDEMYAYCRWYFKRECYPEDAAMGLIPLNVGCQNKFFGGYDLKKDIDIFCSFGHYNNGYRYETTRLCERLGKEGYRVVIAKGLEYQEYLRTINRSYISISSWGAGNSCMRLYENMANASCCFAQRTEIAFIDKPEDGLHYVEYSSMSEFESRIREFLPDKQSCVDIGKRGLDFVSRKHTGKARFSYIIEQLSKNK